MMKIIYPKPAPKILHFVRNILLIEHGQVSDAFVLPLFANGTPTLLFTSSPAYLGESKQDLLLFGQTVLPRELLIRDHFILIAYFFQPCALGALFNIAASELTDQPIALDLVSGGKALQEQLLNAATNDDLLRMIDDYLVQKINSVSVADERLIYAAGQIVQNPCKEILTTLQQELHLTERTFQRLFENQVGVSPNLFRRINQFNQAFRQINGPHVPDFTAIAYGNGYADQSHMIRAFREFTRLTTNAYLRARAAV